MCRRGHSLRLWHPLVPGGARVIPRLPRVVAGRRGTLRAFRPADPTRLVVQPSASYTGAYPDSHPLVLAATRAGGARGGATMRRAGGRRGRREGRAHPHARPGPSHCARAGYRTCGAARAAWRSCASRVRSRRKASLCHGVSWCQGMCIIYPHSTDNLGWLPLHTLARERAGWRMRVRTVKAPAPRPRSTESASPTARCVCVVDTRSLLSYAISYMSSSCAIIMLY